MEAEKLARSLAVIGAGVGTAVVVKKNRPAKKSLVVPVISGLVAWIVAGTINNSI